MGNKCIILLERSDNGENVSLYHGAHMYGRGYELYKYLKKPPVQIELPATRGGGSGRSTTRQPASSRGLQPLEESCRILLTPLVAV